MPMPVGFLKPWSKDLSPEDRRLWMWEPTTHFPGSGVVAVAGDERMLASSDRKEEQCDVLIFLMSSPIVIFAVLLNNRISGIKTYLRIQQSTVLRSQAPAMMDLCRL